MFLSIYTGCRPGEPADASRRAGRKAASRKHPSVETWDAVHDMDVENCAEEAEGFGEPNYQRLEPWADKNDTEYDDDHLDPGMLILEYKALCYEDISLWIVRNPTPGEQDVLGTEITYAQHKGADRKPKPYVRLQSLCLIPTNPTTSARLSAFMKKPFPYFALSVMSWLRR